MAVATFADARREWLKQFFELPFGIPSHDTFGRMMGLIDPKECSVALVNWTSALQSVLKSRVIAIDGKTARGSASKKKGRRPLHIVSDDRGKEDRLIPGLPPLRTVRAVFPHTALRLVVLPQ